MSSLRPPCDEGVLLGAPAAAPGSAPWVLAGTILGSSMAFIDGTAVNVAITTDGSYGTTVTPGATLQLQGGITVSTENLTISGQGVFQSQAQTIVVAGTGTFTLSFNGQTTSAISTSSGTLANDINAVGQITGQYFDSNKVAHGYLWIP